jgi:hypothetical protein
MTAAMTAGAAASRAGGLTWVPAGQADGNAARAAPPAR